MTDQVDHMAEDEIPAEDAVEMLRKREIVAHTAQETGQSKADIRRTLDAALGFMRAGLLEGKEVHYPSLGKVRIKAPNREGAKPAYRLIPAKDQVQQDEPETEE